MIELIEPHGGKLQQLIVSGERKAQLKELCKTLKSHDLTSRQLCDIELLMNGGFSPLNGFMNKGQYEGCVENIRLPSGVVWPMPITLDVSEEFSKSLRSGEKIALRDKEGVVLAVMTVSDVFTPNKENEALKVFGSSDDNHAGVDYLLNQSGPVYVGGSLEGLELPLHYTYRENRFSPSQLRDHFKKMGWSKIVAFQTRNPMHRAHFELTIRASKQEGAAFLLNPVVGMTKPGDVDYFTRVRCYKKLLNQYPQNSSKMSLLQLAMRMGGPREALWHALIRKNHGCTHFIVGRDHAGPGKNKEGKDFYGPYDAQEMVTRFENEIGIKMVPFKMMVYVPDKAQYMAVDEVPEGVRTLKLSGTELRRRLKEGLDIPDWFSFPQVIEELRQVYPTRTKQGFTIFFTGLSGSGKSTIANAVVAKLKQIGTRPVTLLDGDIVRKNLSSELGFSKAHRDLNITRIGFVASEITKNKGIAVCAPIAPYGGARVQVRQTVGKYGSFLLVHVSTPLEECEKRDRKGLYAKARAGIIKGFTGIDDPYEAPKDAEMTIDTTHITPEEAANHVMFYLRMHNYIK